MTSLPHEKSREVNHASDICGEVFNTDHHGRKQKKNQELGLAEEESKGMAGSPAGLGPPLLLGCTEGEGQRKC